MELVPLEELSNVTQSLSPLQKQMGVSENSGYPILGSLS